MRYDWLMLDADNTLFDYDAAEKAALSASLGAFGHVADHDTIATYRKLNSELWRQYERRAITQDLLRVRRFQMLQEELGFDGDPETFSRTYLDHLSHSTHLMPDADRVVHQLAERLSLLLITNGLSTVQRTRLAESTLADCFVDADGTIERLVVSEEVGAAKPDPAIFDAAFEAMGNPDGRTVAIVGDSLTSDIAGGRAYGIDTCLYDPAGTVRAKVRPGEEPTYVISQLTELLTIVSPGGIDG